MQPVLSRAQVRAFERHAIDSCAVESAWLMENAGAAAAAHILTRSPGTAAVLVVAGPGNNGGDGFVVARHLRARGLTSEVALQGEASALKGDAQKMHAAFVGTGGICHSGIVARDIPQLALRFELIVDALFGTGLSRPLAGELAELVEALNASSLPTIALDLPSGLDADTGASHIAVVHAQETLTFAFPKLGLYTEAGALCAGERVCLTIGTPTSAYPSRSAWLYDRAAAAEALDRGPEPAHKGAAGKVLIFGGGPGTLGAARLCAHGALRAGAGLVKIATFGEAAKQLQATTWEVLTHSLEPSATPKDLPALVDWADAIVVGPGLGTTGLPKALIRALLQDCPKKLLVDADALTVLSTHPEMLAAPSGPRLLTPHPAEAARLLSSSAAEVQADRFGALARLLEQTRVSVLLKGVHTLVGSPELEDELPRINTTGNSLLAVGGSGDVLAGIIATLSCHRPLHQAASLGAWLHGAAADSLRALGRDRGVLASELADAVPGALAQLASGGTRP